MRPVASNTQDVSAAAKSSNQVGGTWLAKPAMWALRPQAAPVRKL